MRESKNAPPTAIEICELCHGTIYSGELRSCSVTEDVLEDREAKHCAGEGRIHFHCLQPHEDTIIADERWYCTVCCDVSNISFYFILFLIRKMRSACACYFATSVVD